MPCQVMAWVEWRHVGGGGGRGGAPEGGSLSRRYGDSTAEQSGSDGDDGSGGGGGSGGGDSLAVREPSESSHAPRPDRTRGRCRAAPGARLRFTSRIGNI